MEASAALTPRPARHPPTPPLPPMPFNTAGSAAILALIAALLAALLCASRGDEFKARNDTNAYYNQYVCLSRNNDPSYCRSDISSSPLEVIYEGVVRAGVYAFGRDGFWWYKFSLSLVVFFSIIWSVLLVSGNPIVSLIVLLSDFRFWEYGANVLREGVAAAFLSFALALYILGSRKSSLVLRCLAVGSHLSSLAAVLFTARRFSLRHLGIGLTVAVLAAASWKWWFKLIIGSNLFIYKIQAYIFDSKGYALGMPLLYFAAIALTLPIYAKNISRTVNVAFNFVYLLLLVALPLGALDLGYRIVSFMVPAIALLLPEAVDYYSQKFGQRDLVFTYLIALTFFVSSILAFRNSSIFVMNLAR
jgi:hypothetical protein